MNAVMKRRWPKGPQAVPIREASLQTLKEDKGSEGGGGGMQLCAMEGVGNEVG
jgi:hypothetical protein